MKYFLIGKDISHSLSPQIHAQIYKEIGVSATYELCPMDDVADFAKIDLFGEGFEAKSEVKSEVKSEAKLGVKSEVKSGVKLGEKSAVLGVKSGAKIGGFNVTTPFKSAILDYVDHDLSGCGSANTLKVQNGEIFAYSTDGRGFILDAKRLNLDLSRVEIVGLGGAARSIIYQLCKTDLGAKSGADLGTESVADLGTESGADLGADLANVGDKKVVKPQIKITSKHANFGNYERLFGKNSNLNLGEYNANFVSSEDFAPTLIINCSGADLPQKTDIQTYDLRYKSNQNGTFCGLGMLIYQAILSDEIFFDKKIDLSIFSKIYNNLK